MDRPEDRLTALLSAMNEGAVIHDANGRVETCNESAGRILGMAAGQMCGLDSLDPQGLAIHEDGTSFPGETHPAVVTLRTGQPQTGVIMGIYRPDGALRWISINSRAIFRDGKPESVISTFTDVTGQRAAVSGQIAPADSTEGSGRLYRDLFEGAVEGMFRTSPEGRSLAANPALARILGYSSEEEVESAISDTSRQVWLDPNERLRLLQTLEDQGVALGYECQFKRKDGAPVWVSLDTRKVCGADGRTLWYEGFLQDIGERKRTEDALRESERKFATLFRFSPAATSLTDVAAGFRFVDVNEAFEQTMGYERGDVIERTSAELGLWPDPEEFTEAASQLRRDGRLRDFAFHFRRKDGVVRNGLISAETIDLGGRAFVLAATIDVTELRQSEETLRETSQQLLKIANCVPDTIWTIDLSGRFTYLSSNVERTHGWTVEEALNRNFREMATPEQAIRNERRLAEELNRAASPQYDRNYVARFESEELRKDGTVFWAEINSSLLWSDDGRPIGMIGITRDISDRKRTERELQEHRDHLEDLVRQRTEELMIARDQAVAASRAKGVFLANMSHELRTPLNSILGFSNLLRANSVSQEQHTQLDIINRSAEHLLTLINAVLDLAKIEAGKQELAIETCDLTTLVQDVVEMLRVRADARNLLLTCVPSANLPRYVRTDASKLRQVMINLLGNAIKFTEAGSVTLRVEASNADGDGRVRLRFEVEDTGVGIPAERQACIFEPFVQEGTPGAQQGGTGLGLTITRHYVEMMSGTLKLESTPGKGSRFTVEVPAEAVRESEVSRAETGGEHQLVLQPGQPEWRVLVVEDNPESALLLEQILKQAGFDVRVAENGLLGVQEFVKWRPHFIWMDSRMPEMNGAEAIRQIRELEHGRDVKIAATTASVFGSERAQVLDAGVDDFVLKPYRPAEVFACMERLLGARYRPAEPAAPEVGTALLLPESLAALPNSLLRVLSAAVISLDREQVSAAIDRVGDEDASLAAVLRRLHDHFAYTAIHDAIKRSESEAFDSTPGKSSASRV